MSVLRHNIVHWWDFKKIFIAMLPSNTCDESIWGQIRWIRCVFIKKKPGVEKQQQLTQNWNDYILLNVVKYTYTFHSTTKKTANTCHKNTLKNQSQLSLTSHYKDNFFLAAKVNTTRLKTNWTSEVKYWTSMELFFLFHVSCVLVETSKQEPVLKHPTTLWETNKNRSHL